MLSLLQSLESYSRRNKSTQSFMIPVITMIHASLQAEQTCSACNIFLWWCYIRQSFIRTYSVWKVPLPVRWCWWRVSRMPLSILQWDYWVTAPRHVSGNIVRIKLCLINHHHLEDQISRAIPQAVTDFLGHRNFLTLCIHGYYIKISSIITLRLLKTKMS